MHPTAIALTLTVDELATLQIALHARVLECNRLEASAARLADHDNANYWRQQRHNALALEEEIQRQCGAQR